MGLDVGVVQIDYSQDPEAQPTDSLGISPESGTTTHGRSHRAKASLPSTTSTTCLIPFLCDTAVFSLGGLMDSRFRGNDGWEHCGILFAAQSQRIGITVHTST